MGRWNRPLWRGRQWIVRPTRIYSPADDYSIDMKRIAETRSDGVLGLPPHMAEKGWVDMDDFENAYRFAVKRFAKHVTEDDIEDAFWEAHKLRRPRR